MWSSGTPTLVKALLVIAIFQSAQYAQRIFGKHSSNRVTGFTVYEDKSELARGGAIKTMSKLQLLYFSEYLTILRFPTKSASLSPFKRGEILLVLPQTLLPGQYSRLSAYLRFGG